MNYGITMDMLDMYREGYFGIVTCDVVMLL